MVCLRNHADVSNGVELSYTLSHGHCDGDRCGTDSMLIPSTIDARRARSLLRVVHFGLTAQAYGLRDVLPATVASSDSL